MSLPTDLFKASMLKIVPVFILHSITKDRIQSVFFLFFLNKAVSFNQYYNIQTHYHLVI